MKPSMDRQLTEELHRIQHRYLLRILLFVMLYLCGAMLALAAQSQLGGQWWSYLLCFPFYLLAAASLHGISLFTHEGVHGALFQNKLANRLLGAICAWPVLQNFSAYRVLHLRHHQNLGENGDPDHYKNYTSSKILVFAMHWGRLLFGYPAYISAIPILGILKATNGERMWILVEVGAVVCFVFALFSYLPAEYLLHGWICPMLCIHFMVNIRGMSQHTLLEHESDAVMGTRTILTNPLTRFFMCNENYHLEHHIYPGVPWYNLPRVHQELRPELERIGAPFIASYAHFVYEFVMASFARKDVGTVTLDRA